MPNASLRGASLSLAMTVLVASCGARGGASVQPLPALCSLPAEDGDCDAYIPMFFYNPGTQACERFVYGGCGGNRNRFRTVEECEAACGG